MVENSKRKMICSFIGAIIGAFMLVGGRLFIYGKDLYVIFGENTKNRDIFIFVAMIVVCFGMVYCLIGFWEKRILTNRKEGDKEIKKTSIKSFFLLWIIAMLVICVWLYAFNPAILYWDSAYQLAQAQHVVPYDNWHPLYTTLWIELILSICNNLSVVVLVGAAFWTAVIAAYANWLIGITGKRLRVTIGMIVFLFVPNQALASVTILKDVPYVTCVAWMTFIVLRIIFSYKDKILPWYMYVEIIVSSMTAWVVRSNGFVLSIGFWILLVLVLRKKEIYVTILLSVAWIVLFNGILYHIIEYKDYSKGYTYMTLVSDLQVIYCAGGEVEEEIVEVLLQANEQEEWARYYGPNRQNAVNSLTYVPEAMEEYGMIKFLCDYSRTAISNLGIWIEAVLMRVLPLWDIAMEYGDVSVIGVTMYPDASAFVHEGKTFAEYGFVNYNVREPNVLTKVLQDMVDWTVKMPQKRIFWHTGVFLLFLIWEILFIVYKKMYIYLLVFAPVGLHILSLLLSTGWSNYRYFWPVEVVAVMLILLMNLIGKNIDKEGKLKSE